MDLTYEDYIYIESIGLLIHYYELEKEVQLKYANLCVEALKIATSKQEMHKALFQELIAQDAIALQIRDNTAIQPDNGMPSVLETLFKYAGNLGVDIIVNIDDGYIKLMSTTIDKVLMMFK